MAAFLVALFLVFIAEMGDKTQLVALAFATIYPARTVMSGILIATLFVHLISVGIGQMVGMALPVFWIKIAAGIAFIGFAWWTLKGDEFDGKDDLPGKRFGPLLTVVITFFLAELGDKTMLATIAIASQWNNFTAVWLGSTLGMVGADGLAVAAGKLIDRQLSPKFIKYSAAATFALSGICFLAEALFVHRI